ncbi:MAG: phosphatase PAP2 family protein [Chitinophagales bacterium]|nr:phosphatase PAP2 family protein [Chitinophagales bacterium]
MNKVFFFLLLLVCLDYACKAQINIDSILSVKDTLGVSGDSLLNSGSPASVEDSIHTIINPSSLHTELNLKSAGSRDHVNCPFHIKPAIDISITVLGIAGTITGFSLLSKKTSSDVGVILNLDPERDIKIGINRHDIHNYSVTANNLSDVFFYSSFLYGLILLADREIRQDALKIALLYVQTLGITGTSYSLAAASVDKYRPYVYNKDSLIVDGIKVPEVPIEKKTSNHAKDSFYGGHPSVPASSTLFVASVFSAYHPNSPYRFMFYGIAVAATATTAYLRYRGGDHFPTDLAIGVSLGSAYGLLVPYFHQCQDKGFSFVPITGKVKGVNVTYRF